MRWWLPAQVLCRGANKGQLLCATSEAASTVGAENRFAMLMGCGSVTSFHDLGLPRLWRASIALIQLMRRSAKEDAI